MIGCGDVAQRDYLPELHRLAGRAELIAVCGRGSERVRAVAAQYGIPRWYTDYRQMLAEPMVDAVVNLTPIQAHAEVNLAVLEAGKHLYTEKPVVGSVAEADQLAAEMRRRDLKVVCAPCVMLFPQVQYARTLLADGAIGAVYSARGHGHGGVPPWSGYQSDPSQFFTTGAGPALDMGVYPLHALTGLLGPVVRVVGMKSRANHGFVVPDGPVQGKHVEVTVDDNWHMLLDLGSARLASVDANNVVQATRAPQLEIFGLAGTIALDLLDVSAPVEVFRAGHGWERIQLPQSGRAAGPDHLLGIEHLVDCVAADRNPVLSLEHATHVVEIIEQAAHSAVKQQMLAVEHTFDPNLGG
jgi:predicted dehydrogenase